MKNILTLLFTLYVLGTQAQTGAGSYESENGNQLVESGTFKMIFSESFYLGQNANLLIEGELHIFSKYIWISPNAKIAGSGKLVIHNPNDNPLYDSWTSQPTQIDGNNGQYIDVNIVLQNDQGLHLVNLPNQGFADQPSTTAPEKQAAFRFSKTLFLDVDGAHIFLKGHDLELASTGDIQLTSADRFVVTDNSVAGHMIKNYGPTVVEFAFPVGIAVGDYTPARLKPTQTGAVVYVSVTDYTASGLTIQDETIGMDRIWNIYADQRMQMDYTLIHNMATNGIAYVDPQAQIVQQADDRMWIGDVTTFQGTGIHTRQDIETKTKNTLFGTWLTKFTNTPPTAVDDHVNVTYEQPQTIDVLINDLPGNGLIVRNLTHITIDPTHGTAEIVNGSIRYTPNPGYIGEDKLEYEIENTNGQTSRAFVYITILARDLFIPNIITPNGDGKNDNFVIKGLEGFDEINLVIFNVWGNEVYSNNHYTNNWSGRGLNEGTYYYVLKLAKGSDVKMYKGYITIKRN